MYSSLLLLPCFVYHPLLLHEYYQHKSFIVISITLYLETAWPNSLYIDIHVLHTYWCITKVCVCVRTRTRACIRAWGVCFDMDMLHTNILVCVVTYVSLHLQTELLGLNWRCDVSCAGLQIIVVVNAVVSPLVWCCKRKPTDNHVYLCLYNCIPNFAKLSVFA